MFSIELKVRDYELDLQGIVNNSNYQRYLEHARHEYLLTKGVDFAALHDQGNDLVVTRVEMDFKSPLKSGDKFRVDLDVALEGYIKIVFNQKIVKLPEEKLVVKAKVYGVSVKNGRPSRPDGVIEKILS